jgi:hypothetical protein
VGQQRERRFGDPEASRSLSETCKGRGRMGFSIIKSDCLWICPYRPACAFPKAADLEGKPGDGHPRALGRTAEVLFEIGRERDRTGADRCAFSKRIPSWLIEEGINLVNL